MDIRKKGRRCAPCVALLVLLSLFFRMRFVDIAFLLNTVAEKISAKCTQRIMAVTAEHYLNINNHNAFEQLSIDAHVDCKACLFLPLQPCHVVQQVAWL